MTSAICAFRIVVLIILVVVTLSNIVFQNQWMVINNIFHKIRWYWYIIRNHMVLPLWTLIYLSLYLPPLLFLSFSELSTLFSISKSVSTILLNRAIQIISNSGHSIALPPSRAIRKLALAPGRVAGFYGSSGVDCFTCAFINGFEQVGNQLTGVVCYSKPWVSEKSKHFFLMIPWSLEVMCSASFCSYEWLCWALNVLELMPLPQRRCFVELVFWEKASSVWCEC